MNTLAAVHAGIAGKLITRAADVTMKEGRSLILAPREMPFNTIHLRNMYELSQAGVKIVVPAPAFYNHPTSIDDMINYVTGKILDALEVPNDIYRRWK
jgi:4-hydroxy-3-polyprenylbenzoate decarboxylase